MALVASTAKSVRVSPMFCTHGKTHSCPPSASPGPRGEARPRGAGEGGGLEAAARCCLGSTATRRFSPPPRWSRTAPRRQIAVIGHVAGDHHQVVARSGGCASRPPSKCPPIPRSHLEELASARRRASFPLPGGDPTGTQAPVHGTLPQVSACHNPEPTVVITKFQDLSRDFGKSDMCRICLHIAPTQARHDDRPGAGSTTGDGASPTNPSGLSAAQFARTLNALHFREFTAICTPPRCWSWPPPSVRDGARAVQALLRRRSPSGRPLLKRLPCVDRGVARAHPRQPALRPHRSPDGCHLLAGLGDRLHAAPGTQPVRVPLPASAAAGGPAGVPCCPAPEP